MEVIKVYVRHVATSSGDWTTGLILTAVMLVLIVAAFFAIRYQIKHETTQSAEEPAGELKRAA